MPLLGDSAGRVSIAVVRFSGGVYRHPFLGTTFFEDYRTSQESATVKASTRKHCTGGSHDQFDGVRLNLWRGQSDGCWSLARASAFTTVERTARRQASEPSHRRVLRTAVPRGMARTP